MKGLIKGKRPKKMFMKAVTIATVVTSVGCASIVSNSKWPVTVESNPSGAKCVIVNEAGEQLHMGRTPMQIKLDSGQGYFQSANYTIHCWKDGYYPTQSGISSSMNSWYWGNIVFGGLIGMLIVDPMTGAMWKLQDTQTVSLFRIEYENQGRSNDQSSAPKYEY